MGHGFHHTLGISRSAYFVGLVFVVIIILQYFEFPYGDVISSLFSASKIHITHSTNRTSSNCTADNATTALTSPQILLHSNMSETHKNADQIWYIISQKMNHQLEIFSHQPIYPLRK
ncbi:hypothetical protein HanIR_Chr11g0556141 [Helianthus annuus]|nr:hypothetical protein HanIR_Chr11g0556141 [Helianthus annuus]